MFWKKKKVFEDYFSETQSDMIAICLEYVENRGEKIYIYCSYEDKVVTSNVFYKINEKIVKKHKLNDANYQSDNPFDVSIERQKATISVINDDIKRLIKLCDEYRRDMPTQIKLTYDIKSKSVNAEYQYDLIYSMDMNKDSNDIFEDWIKLESSN